VPTIRNTFHRGIMDKDTDERLMGEGFLRHAENVHISTSEGSDVGSVENILSNRKRTNINFGNNAFAIGNYVDKAKNKIYWFVVSDKGCYLAEFNQQNGTATIILEDTRVQSERVLDLNRNFPITGISKIVSEQDDKDLLLWTDDNMEVCCINIERAKTYPSNGFAKEDIFLIKKPPLHHPTTELVYTSEVSKNIEERFFCFAYRYKYLDGEYSALSPFSNYMFLPKHFSMDYDTLENTAMVNLYNAVKVEFDTGDKRVTDVQIIAKSSNSNNLYIVENFNKKEQGFGHNETKSLIYKNDKLYSLLPEKELYRLFDNVPRKAKALTLIGNRPVLGNYLEGYDLFYDKDKKIKIDFKVFVNSKKIDQEKELSLNIAPSHVIGVNLMLTGLILLKEGSTIVFSLVIDYKIESPPGGGGLAFEQEFAYTLKQDYLNLFQLWSDPDFISFTQVINANFKTNYLIESVPDGWAEDSKGSLWATTGGDLVNLVLGWATYIDTNDGNKKKHISFKWNSNTKIYLTKDNQNTSLHSNGDYQVAMLYVDEFGRETTGLVCPTNTVYVKQENSVTKNTIGVKIYHKPPVWAKYYRFAVKSQRLTYQTIYISKFYVEDMFTWCLLVGDNKDKVKRGDEIILKRGSELPAGTVAKVKVLDVVSQEKDFITANKNDDGNDIIEEAGLYMKIKPVGFSMSQKDYKFYTGYGHMATKDKNNVPVCTVNLFNTENNPALGLGSEIYIHIKSIQHLKSSDHMVNDFEKTYYTDKTYNSFDQWLLEHFIGQNIYGVGDGSDVNLKDKIALDFEDNGKLYLKIKGVWPSKNGNNTAVIEVWINLRATKSDSYVFETAPDKETELKVFYHSAETFLIEDGNHKANVTDQDVGSGTPAEVELSFHNCYTFGNGVESYKIKDAFNSNFLNVDLKPTAVSEEEYRAIRRYADLTYSEPYVESTNINGINEFNNSTANWKELDKQDGLIQILHSRENDLLVVQKNKWGKVLFGKDALFNTEGQTSLSKVPYVLGQYIPYAGDYGMTDPTSFAVRARQCYGVDKDRGVVLRLSDNGLTPIVYGMQDWFRDVFHRNKKSVVTGGIDPYHNLYQITIPDASGSDSTIKCGGNLSMFDLSEGFSFYIELNDLSGLMSFLFTITSGTADIIIEFDGQEHLHNQASGNVNIGIDRVNTEQNMVKVTIIPNSDVVSFDFSSECPQGEQMKLVTMVLTDPGVDLTSLINKFRWGDSHYFDVPNLPYDQNYGVRGLGKFPSNNSQVHMTKTDLENSCGHRLLYAIGEYSEAEVLDNAIEHSGVFTFLTADPNATLYLIWDYTDKKVIPVFGDFESVCQDETPNLPTTSLNGIIGSWTKLQSIMLDNSTDRYLFTPLDGQCAEPVEVEIEVIERVLLGFDVQMEYCLGETINMPTTSDNGIKGSWTYKLAEETEDYFLYHYTFTPNEDLPCVYSMIYGIRVYKEIIFNNLQKEYCQDEDINLPTTSDNGQDGYWIYEKIEETDEYISYKYTFTPFGFGQCEYIVHITVYKKKTPIFNNIPTSVCLGASFSLSPISDNGISGSWSPALNNQTTTTYTFTPSVWEKCAKEIEVTIEVSELELPVFNNLPTEICEGENIGLPTVSDNGIIGSWLMLVSIDKGDHYSLSYTFTPDDGQCAETFVYELAAYKKDAPTFPNIKSHYCEDENIELPTISDNGIPGVWTKKMFSQNEVAAFWGYTFTPLDGQCAKNYYMNVFVYKKKTPTFPNIKDNYCDDENIELPTISDNVIPGVWTKEIIYQDNHATRWKYTFTPDDGQCAEVFEKELTIWAIPIANNDVVTIGSGQSYVDIFVMNNDVHKGEYTHIEIITPPQYGTIQILVGGNSLEYVRYTPTHNPRNDVFAYRICNGQPLYGCCSNVVKVVITAN